MIISQGRQKRITADGRRVKTATISFTLPHDIINRLEKEINRSRLVSDLLIEYYQNKDKENEACQE